MRKLFQAFERFKVEYLLISGQAIVNPGVSTFLQSFLVPPLAQ